MSFGGPQWPQEPQQQGQQGWGGPPQGPPQGQPGPYGQQPGPHGPQPGPYGQQQPPPPPWQQQPGPAGGDTPDWGALADASAAGSRRKRRLVVAGGVLATVAVGALVATAVVATNKKNDEAKNGGPTPAPTATATASPTPEPTFSSVAPPPPPDPKDYITDPKKDTAPLTAEGLFPGKKLTMAGRPYRKGATSSTTKCASVTQGALGSVLNRHGCERVVRATYVKDGVAVTVGVAVFPSEKAALAAKKEASGGIAPLAGSGVPGFCRATVCLRRSNSLGRYAYFTQAGFLNGAKVTTADKPVFQASDDLGTFVFNQIYARGRSQAKAAASAPPQ
ncbi:hypothetical protein [Streptomyces termitum]|uniref:hypothetical protein n=1 Tax=Streptomyces termitum TaxID=67368 RepID=UPI0037B8A01D